MIEHVAEYSLLLSLLGIGVTVLAGQVATAWLRLAQRGGQPERQWRALAMAALVLGTGVCASAVLTLSAEGLPFTLGFHYLGGATLWLLAVAGCLPAVALLAWKPGSATMAASGCVLAAVVLLEQMGWVAAAGMLPGVAWHWSHVALAGLLLSAGISSAWWLLAASSSRAGLRRPLMRGGAVLLLALVIVGGQELLILAANLAEQKRAEHAYDLNAALLSLVCGALVPMLLAMMSLDVSLRSRRRGRREARNDFTPTPRRRRRERTRSA